MSHLEIDFDSKENLVLLPGHSTFSSAEIEVGLMESGIVGCVVFQTSGSTGRARVVCHSKRGLRCSAEAVNRHLGVVEEDAWLCVLPVFHVGGFGVYARAECSGSRVYGLGKGWSAVEFAAACDEYGVAFTSLVPTQVFDLVHGKVVCPACLRGVLVGGGWLDAGLEVQARELGWPLLRTYGLSEAGSQVATQCGDQLELLSHLEARLDGDGRLSLRGESIADCYLSLGDDGVWERTGLVDGDGWFETDDLVCLDGRVLSFVGRVSSRVKVLGELVDVEALEVAFLAGMDQPVEVALIDVPDRRAESEIVVVHGADVAGERVQARTEVFNASVAGFERVTRVMEVAEIPRGDLGKIRRGELRQMVTESQK